MKRLKRVVTKGCYFSGMGELFAPEVSVIFDSEFVRVIIRGLTVWPHIVFEIKLEDAFKEALFTWLWSVPGRTCWDREDMETALKDAEFFKDSAAAEHLADKITEALTVFIVYSWDMEERTRLLLTIGDDSECTVLEHSFQSILSFAFNSRLNPGESHTYVLNSGVWVENGPN